MGGGLLHSDQQLFNVGSTASTDFQVTTYNTGSSTFASDFASAILKMGNLCPLTRSNGQIRTDCKKINWTLIIIYIVVFQFLCFMKVDLRNGFDQDDHQYNIKLYACGLQYLNLQSQGCDFGPSATPMETRGHTPNIFFFFKYILLIFQLKK